MTHIEFFKFQAKNLLHDWQYYQENHITKELKTKSKFFGHDLFKYTNYKYTIKHPLKVQHEFQLSPVGIPIKMQVK